MSRPISGRRHPWTLGCSVVAALGIVVVAASPAVPVMAVGWFIAELGLARGGTAVTIMAAWTVSRIRSVS